jgi:hypothetical protein
MREYTCITLDIPYVCEIRIEIDGSWAAARLEIRNPLHEPVDVLLHLFNVVAWDRVHDLLSVAFSVVVIFTTPAVSVCMCVSISRSRVGGKKRRAASGERRAANPPPPPASQPATPTTPLPSRFRFTYRASSTMTCMISHCTLSVSFFSLYPRFSSRSHSTELSVCRTMTQSKKRSGKKSHEWKSTIMPPSWSIFISSKASTTLSSSTMKHSYWSSQPEWTGERRSVNRLRK